MHIRSAFCKRERVQVSFVDEFGEAKIGRCKQSFKGQCDINNVLKGYDKTGLITHVNSATAEYGDFTVVNEYQENLNMVIAAEAAFSELPSLVRKKFANDAGAFF